MPFCKKYYSVFFFVVLLCFAGDRAFLEKVSSANDVGQGPNCPPFLKQQQMVQITQEAIQL